MRKIFYKYIIIILSFYAFWLFGIPFIFSKTLPWVCKNVSENSRYQVEVINPKLKLGFLPLAQIKAEQVKIQEKETNDYTHIHNPSVKIRLLPLLSGRLHINVMQADEIIVNALLKKDIELDKNFFNNIKSLKVKCDEVKLSRSMVTLWHKDVKSPVIYTGKDIYYKKNGRFIDINFSSKIDINNSVSKAEASLYLPRNNDVKNSQINISITNFNLEPLGDYLKQYLPSDLVNLQGIINVNVDKSKLQATLDNCAILMRDSAKSIIFPDKLKINSTFHSTSKLINFENVNINSDNINIALNGIVSNYLESPLTTLNLNIQLNESNVHDIINLLPPIIVEEFNVYKLKKYKVYGKTIGNFSIKGDVKEPEITGDVFIDDIILTKPIKNARGATVKLSFTGKYLNFDVNVPAGGQEKVWVKGGVELYNVKYADMRVWSTKNVDLSLAEEKILPIHEILNFIIGPVPIMNIKGNGNIDIIVKGNRKNPHVWGVLNFYNVTTYFNEMKDLVLEKGEAVLSFNDQNASFITKKGELNGKPIEIRGVCTLDGKFDFDVKSSNQELSGLYKALQTSTMIKEVHEMLPKLDFCNGLTNLNFKVYGAVKYIENLKFNKNFSAKGALTLLGNSFVMQGVTLKNTKGELFIDGLNAKANVTSEIGTSKLLAVASVNNKMADVDVSIPKFNLNDIVPENFQNELGNILLDAKIKYKGKINEIEYHKVNLIANILGTTKENKLKLANGRISLNNDKLTLSNIKGSIDDSSFNINLTADNISSSKPRINGNIQAKSFDLALINMFAGYPFISDNIRKQLNTIKFNKGEKINFNSRINNSKINAYTDLGGISFLYTPLNIPVKIINGSLIARSNNLRLNKINLIADQMPVLVDGEIYDILSKQGFDLYFNSKPQQEFIDKYVNKNQIYPIKIKGDIVYSLRTKGTLDNFDLNAEANMAKDSSIYYLGAMVGDVENAITLNLDTKILNRRNLKIKEFSYDKIISSYGGHDTKLNMLKAKGGIEVFKDDLAFNNLYVKTENPTDARIFNIIFRKPNIKQGQFTSDLKFNGRLSNPKLVGNFHIFETNIPFLDTTMKNITLLFKEKTIELSSFGEILGNDISIKGVMKNRLIPPYHIENATLQTKLLDLNYIINKLKLSQVDNYHTFESFEGFDLSSVVIDNIKLEADSVHLRNIIADRFFANASLNKNGIADVRHFRFNIANGQLDGQFKYNLTDNRTGIKLEAKNIDANDLSIAVFDLNNQLYGDMTGDISLACDGTNFDNCMKTLNGTAVFDVADGRMPKLGSLEYLLKAGNLIKGGLTGISINSILDIITPLKTGEFSNIHGDIVIKDGIARNMEILSKGKDLNLFITGDYNFSTADAEMEVFGLLSRKISTMFGPIGNLSLNTLFNAIPGVDLSKDTILLESINKIPGIELSSKDYRKFIAEIKGNINGEDYVTSFKWVN